MLQHILSFNLIVIIDSVFGSHGFLGRTNYFLLNFHPCCLYKNIIMSSIPVCWTVNEERRRFSEALSYSSVCLTDIDWPSTTLRKPLCDCTQWIMHRPCMWVFCVTQVSQMKCGSRNWVHRLYEELDITFQCLKCCIREFIQPLQPQGVNFDWILWKCCNKNSPRMEWFALKNE